MNTQITAAAKLFIGLDIHKKSWQLHLRTDICDHRGFSMPADPDKLYRYVSKNFPDHQIYLTYEAGCCGFWAARYFLNLGWSVMVINPSDLKHSDKDRYRKTDKTDSRRLCVELSKDELTAVYVPTEEQEQLRSLLRQRNSVVKLLRKEKSQIKSMLLFHGKMLPDEYDNPNWSSAFMQWLSAVTWSNITGSQSMQSKLRILTVLHKEYLETGNQLRSYCRLHYSKDYYLLKSIPGFGGIVASAILAELGDLRRFNNEREISNCIGVVPGIYQSAETERSTGITPRCKALLRSYIIEAAWTAIRHDPAMQAYYRKHVGKNHKNIIIKVAHKLIRAMLSVIKNEKPYQVNYLLQ